MLNRNLSLFLFADALINVGYRCATIATSWWALNTNNSEFNLSVLIIVPTIIGLLALPLLSPLGDFHNKKQVMLISHFICFISSLAIATFGFLQIFNLFGIASLLCVINICSAVSYPVFNSGIVELAAEGNVENAYGIERIISSISTLFAPILGAFIISVGSIYMALAIDACGLFFAFVFISFVKFNYQKGQEMTSRNNSWWELVIDGFKVKFIIKLELYWGAIVAVLNFFVTPFITFTLPYFLKNDVHQGILYLGLSQSSLCIGTLLGSAFIIKILNLRFSKDMVCAFAICCEGIAMLLISLIGSLYPQTVLLGMVLMGSAIAIHNINADTYKMLAMPIQFRARLSAVNSLLSRVIVPLGTYASSLVVLHYPARSYIMISGFIVLLISPLMLFIPKFRYFLQMDEQKIEGIYLQFYPALAKMVNKT